MQRGDAPANPSRLRLSAPASRDPGNTETKTLFPQLQKLGLAYGYLEGDHSQEDTCPKKTGQKTMLFCGALLSTVLKWALLGVLLVR